MKLETIVEVDNDRHGRLKIDLEIMKESIYLVTKRTSWIIYI